MAHLSNMTEGTFRLHIIEPFSGWISKKRRLVRLKSSAVSTAKLHSNIADTRNEFEILISSDEDCVDFISGEARSKRDARYFNGMQGTQYERHCHAVESFKSEDGRLRITSCSTLAALEQDISSKSFEATKEIIGRCTSTLSVLYCRLLLMYLMESAQSAPLSTVRLILSSVALQYPDAGYQPAAHLVVEWLHSVIYQRGISSDPGRARLARMEDLSIHLPSFEDKMLSLFTKILTIPLQEHSDLDLGSFREKFHHELIMQLARQIRLASASQYSEHVWTDDPERLVVLERDTASRPSIRFAEWISTLLLASDVSNAVNLLKIWRAASRNSNISLGQVAFRKMTSILLYISEGEGAKDHKLLTLCLGIIPDEALKTESRKRLWMEMEDYPLYSRYLQAMLELLSVTRHMQMKLGNEDDCTPDQCPASSTDKLSRCVISFDERKSGIKLMASEEVRGSWSVEFWLLRRVSSMSDSSYSAPAAVSGHADCLPRLSPLEEEEEYISDKDDDSEQSASFEEGKRLQEKRSTPFETSEVSGPYNDDKIFDIDKGPYFRPEYLLSSSSGGILMQKGGRILNPQDDPDQLSDPVLDAALCMGIGPKSAEKVLNYVVPLEEWTHICITYSHKTNVVSLIANGQLQDTLVLRMALPFSAIGDIDKMNSWCGLLAGFRVWGYCRSAGEIYRDRMRDAIDCKGLLWNLGCSEGSGSCLNDRNGGGCFGRMDSCSWEVNFQAPIIASRSEFPSFVLGDLEEGEGIYGEPLGDLDSITELTGMLSREAFTNSSGAFDSPHDEVIMLCFQQNGRTTDILGYIEWCGREHSRSLISGSVDAEGVVTFSTTPEKTAIVGPPESMAWLVDLTFRGSMVDGKLEGVVDIIGLVPTLPLLPPGGCRILKQYLCHHLRSASTEDGSGNITVDYVANDEARHCHTATVALHTYRNFDTSKLCFHQNSGSFWIDWRINSLGCKNSISLGISMHDLCICNSELGITNISYNSKGQIAVCGEYTNVEAYAPGDEISLEINTDRGYIVFYRNNIFIYNCTSINLTPLALSGYRPFVSLSSEGDSVTLLQRKEGRICLKYPTADAFFRKEFRGRVENGSISGRGCLKFIDRVGYWLGEWVNGQQEGPQLWIDVNESNEEIVLEVYNSVS